LRKKQGKVYIYAIGANIGGALRHISNFLPRLDSEINNQSDVTIAVREPVVDLLGGMHLKNIKIDVLPSLITSNILLRLIYENVYLPIKLFTSGYNKIISLTNFGPIFSHCEHINFQRNPIYYCKYYPGHSPRRLKLDSFLKRYLSWLIMRFSSKIVTPSHAMGEMIKNRFPSLRSKKFQTIYHGFEPQTYHSRLSESFLNSLKFDGVRILYPTHPAPHKGFEVLFKIVDLCRRSAPGFKVFATIELGDWPLIVRRYEETIHRMGLQHHISFIGRVPQDEMLDVYNHVDMVFYPSLCESFGFTMIEAMSCQVPMVVAGTEVNREMCGQGALFYPPTDHHEGARALRYAIENHNELKIKLGKLQMKRMKELDWGWGRYAIEFKTLIDAQIK